MTERETEKLGVGEKSDLYICLYWPPRSGGTFIWQVLSSIFNKVASTHDSDYLGTNLPIVIAYRDFRDVTVSHWRTQYGEYDSEGNLINSPNEGQIRKMLSGTRGSIQRLNLHREKHWGKKNSLWLKYEDFYENHNYLFGAIEKFFNIKLSEEKVKQIAAETCVKNNIERQKKVSREETPVNAIVRTDFDLYNPVNKLHRHHIHTGELDSWKKLLPENLHSMLNKTLSNNLKKWGYIVEGN